MISALIFDFDGTILDTESPDYLSWQATYADYGAELPMSVWQDHIGTDGVFNPFDYLEQQVGRPLDRDKVYRDRKARDNALIAQLTVLPGVLDVIAEAKRFGLKLAIASSSRHSWVDYHLARLGLMFEFELVRCRDDVGDKAKPDPAVYQAVLDFWKIEGEHAIALEDSPHGVSAAVNAGIYTIAIPNQMTQHLPFDHAHKTIPSLTALNLTDHVGKK
jgi:HAD superfamily hydrolase (TIGR01509 family)